MTPDTIIADAVRDIPGWSEIDVDTRGAIVRAWRTTLDTERKELVEALREACAHIRGHVLSGWQDTDLCARIDALLAKHKGESC